jgi:hypothetical protein
MKLIFIGAGNMAEAIIEGTYKTYDVTVVARGKDRLKELDKKFDITIDLLDDKFDISGKNLILCVKPYAIADVFDALGSDRVYKKAWSDEKIINLIIEETGEHFHPVLANLFIANFDKFVEIREKFSDMFEDEKKEELVVA